MQSTINDVALCHHCNDEIKGEKLEYQDHLFCCLGCKTVFEILDQNNLCEYYDLNDKAGFSLKRKPSESFEYLNDVTIIERLSTKISPDLSLVILQLPQIHCSSCVWLLEKLYKFNDGIFSSKVDFIKREIEVRYNHTKVGLREIVEVIDSLGYTPQIELDKNNTSHYDDKLKLKIGIAGFAFGNIMLFSFPEYLGLEDSVYKTWFGIINIMLSIPILFYSGRDYITQAYYSLKHKTYNINIPLALGMLVMFFVSIYQVLTHSGSGYIDSLAGLIFFLLIGKWYQMRSYNYLSFERDYKSYFPISCTKIQNGNLSDISIEKIEIGDELLIKNNQIVPVDGILISDIASVDYSFVTGEEKQTIVLKEEQIYAGGKLKDSNIHMIANKKVKNSYLVSLWNDATFDKHKDEHKPITDKLSKYFTLILLTIAFVSFIYWYSIDFDRAINAFTAVLIVACPCAIALTLPFLYGNLLRLLSKKGIFLRNSLVIDQAAEVSHIVFDKTGTITTQLDKELLYSGKFLDEENKRLIHALAFQSGHPLSIAIEKALRSSVILPVQNFKEYAGLGIEGICSGKFICLGSAKFLNQTNEVNTETRTYIKIDNQVLGYFSFSNKYRASLPLVVNDLKGQHKNLSILSGDNDSERKKLIEIFGNEVAMQFNQDPHQKLSYISKLQQKNKVAMIGDGLNDSGALKQSDLGIVITESNNNFTPACDVIMRFDNFSLLSKFFKLSSYSRYLIFGAYMIAILYNAIGLSYAVRGELSPIIAAILMPLSSVTIVLYTVLSSGLLFRRLMK